MKRNEIGLGRLAVGLSALLFAVGCGGDDTDSASAALEACDSVVDAYARAWDRCERLSYEEARDVFSDAFGCDQMESHDGSSLDECLATIDAMSCSEVTAGTTPVSCQSLVSQ